MVTLHIGLTTKPGQGQALEALYDRAYVPAISKQEGFVSSSLLRAYDSDTQYEIVIAFENEAQRSAWASSADHDQTWPEVEALCDKVSAQGWDVIA